MVRRPSLASFRTTVGPVPAAARATASTDEPTAEGSGAMARHPRPRRPSNLGPAMVLVIEDNEGDAQLLADSLAEIGLRVRCVTRLDDAKEALRAATFDFVLADLHLPDASGLDCVRELSPLAGSAPVIVLTGLDDEELAFHAIQEGAQDYLVKGQANLAIVRRTLRHARERKYMTEQLVHMTRHDVLTGAVNRAALREQVDAALARARRRDARLAVMYIDLDHFKTINDSWGHDAGDAVLREVVTRLRAAVRAGDVVARLGGDEFGVLLADAASCAELLALGHRVRECLALPVAVPGGYAHVSGSIGIACYPETATSTEAILRAADNAMYRAKRDGRNGVRVAGAAVDADDATGASTADLEHALARGEFLLHFQPQFAIPRGQLVGFEALLRWQPPGCDPIPPSEFIPQLEDSGAILEVGNWVIERACEQLAAWRAAGRTGLRVAVNLSARQLVGSGLVVWTRRCLERFAIPARCLELEITESNLMSNTRQTSEILAGLRAIGVRLAIDDFGTGFSSLSYLNQFAVDCLKIDRSLVEQLHADGDGELIAKAVISLGHSLGLEVVAEGVETEEQLASLAAARCDLIQGYLLGRPCAATAFDGSDIWSTHVTEPRTTVPIRRIRA
jgi:diguanylate cyclase